MALNGAKVTAYVYPLLFELAQAKKIRILEENGWGVPLKVELMR